MPKVIHWTPAMENYLNLYVLWTPTPRYLRTAATIAVIMNRRFDTDPPFTRSAGSSDPR